jgi:hypothetical protein
MRIGSINNGVGKNETKSNIVCAHPVKRKGRGERKSKTEKNKSLRGANNMPMLTCVMEIKKMIDDTCQTKI